MSKTVQFQTIQFSISTQFKCKYSLIEKKKFLFRAIQFSQAILLQLIQFCKSTHFVYTQLIQLSTSTQFKCKYGLIVKNIFILSYLV